MHKDTAALASLDSPHDAQVGACRPDPEARLIGLAHAAGPLRRVVAAIAGRLVACGGWKRLGYARPGDYARERLGRSARSLQDWARVDRSLAALPGLERALLDGTLAWSKVRLLARFVTREDEDAWIAYASSQSVRTLEREVRAANRGALETGAGTGAPDEDGDATEWVRVPVSPGVCMKWQRMRRAAPKVAGQRLPPGAILEMVTAEVLSALPLAVDVEAVEDDEEEATRSGMGVACGAAAPSRAEPDACSTGERGPTSSEPASAPPHSRDAGSLASASGAPTPSPDPRALPAFLRSLVDGIDDADPFELDARLRRAVRLEQRLEAELGPLLRQVSSAEHEWKAGCTSLTAFARERLGLSPRKLRALLRVERVGDVCPALRAAYRDGRLSWLQAQLLARLLARDAEGAWRERWVVFAQGVTVRCLEDVVDAALALRQSDPEAWARCEDAPESIARRLWTEAGGARAEGWQVCAPAGDENERTESPEGWRVGIPAPTEVARLFRATLCSVRLAIERETGRLASPGEAFEAMLDHAARSWGIEGAWLGRRKPTSVRVFERDGWCCTVPGCSSQRNLQAHHIRFRSRGGGDEPSNLTTLCAFHHQRGVHAGVITVRGRAPGRLVFELGCRPEHPPLARYRSGDRVIG